SASSGARKSSCIASKWQQSSIAVGSLAEDAESVLFAASAGQFAGSFQVACSLLQGLLDFGGNELFQLAAETRDLAEQGTADMGIGFLGHQEDRFDFMV